MTIPNYIIDAYENVPLDRSITVLLRHSIRYPIENDAEIYTAQLTPEGKKLASTFGSWIKSKFKIGKFFSSPINRCIETGKFMANGAGNGRAILPEPVLGHPNENGEYDSLDDYLASGVWPGRIIDIANKMIPAAHNQAMNFYISHDTVIVLMVAYWLKIDIRAPIDWPQYLEPLFFWKSNGKLKISFRGEFFDVPYTFPG